MLNNRFVGLGLLALFGLSSVTVSARDTTDPYWDFRDEGESGEFAYDDSGDIPWIENETKILALPRDEDLAQAEIDALPPGVRLFIDQARIDVNFDDRIVRLWIVIKSDGGGYNATYEGYRCTAEEYKIYAYGNPRRAKPVRKARKPQWQPLVKKTNGNYRSEVMNDILCIMKGPRLLREIRQAIAGDRQADHSYSDIITF